MKGSRLLGATLITPALLFYIGVASSFAVGVVVVSLCILAIRIRSPVPTEIAMPIISSVRRRRATVTIFAVVAAHLLMSIGLHKVDIARAVTSLIILFIFISASFKLANALICSASETLDHGLSKLFLLFCLSALGGILIATFDFPGPPTLASDPWRRPVFPFSEPATFALALLPVLMYVCSSNSGGFRLFAVLVGSGFSVLLQSLTLACGVFIIALVTLRFKALFVLCVLLMFIIPQLDLTYFYERIDISDENRNLSSLVYLQGWQMIGEAMQRTNYLGLGFQQLGVHGTEVVAAQSIRELKYGEDMNLLDGGFVFAKFGADFGIFAIPVVIFYCIIFVQSLLTLRLVAFRHVQLHSAVILAHASVLTFSIELFVRGAGYFSGTALLFISSLWIALGSRKPIKVR